MYKIGIDMMGGDYAPTQAALGVQAYLLQQVTGTCIYAIGDATILNTLLPNLNPTHCVIVPSHSVIAMKEHPTKAFKEKQDSSIAIGFKMLKEGTIDAFISAGNTGAMLVGTHFSIKTIPGVLRPAIGAVFPRLDGSTGLLCDVGLNADCKPEHLNQFAVLGSAFAHTMLQQHKPTVGLLNIGEEEGKGNQLAQDSYALLKQNPSIHFIGNIEGRDVYDSKATVMVCDGFTGNIVLKMAEQLYEIAQQRNIKDDFLDKCHFETYGGSPLLGVSKPVIIGHGISQQKAFVNMITLAAKMLETNVLGNIENSFKAI